MKHPMTASDKDIIKALVDGWLQAEIEEDAELRSGSKSTIYPGVVLRQQPPWQPDEVVRYLDHDEVSAVQTATPDRRDKLLGPNCYMVENISPLELSRSRQRKIFDDVAGRHAAGDESIASEHVKALLARHGLPIDEFSSSFELASKMMMRAHHDLLLAMRDRDAIGWRPNLDEDPAEALLQKLTRSAIASSGAPVPTPLSGMTLGEACENYVSESLKNEAFKPGRADEVRSAVKNFVDWFERSPDLSEITPQVAGDYRIDMSFYPVSGAKKPAYRDLSMRARIAKSKADAEVHTIAVATINGKYIDPLRGLYVWATSAGKITTNPFVGIKVNSARKQPIRAKREGFTVAQLQTFFGSPLFTGSAGRHGKRLYRPGPHRVDDWHYWLPLMALFSGARLSELGGLLLSDFGDSDGAIWFHIQAQVGGRGTKTEAANRRVPVHPELLRLGLMTRVERLRSQGAKRLFPELTPGARGQLSDKPSKFFADLIDRMIGKDQPVVFHSFRHTFITAMRQAGVPREVRTALVGHEDDVQLRKDIHEGYGAEPRLLAGMESVNWPGLDLSAIRLPATPP